MISNLTLRSNLIEDLKRPSEVEEQAERVNAPLARISARDLHELCQIYRNWIPYFDKRMIDQGIDGLPTLEQKEQWKSYLFYGDKTVSMKDGPRYEKVWEEMGKGLVRGWSSIQSRLDSEMAIECLSVFAAIKEYLPADSSFFSSESFKRIEKIFAEAEQFLEDHCKMSREDQRDRVHQILGLKD